MSMEGVRILKLRTFEGSGFLGKVIYLPYGSNNKLLRMEAKCPMRFGGDERHHNHLRIIMDSYGDISKMCLEVQEKSLFLPLKKN